MKELSKSKILEIQTKNKILAFESSAKSASVCILEDDKVIANYYQDCNITHSQTLLPMFSNILENTDISMQNIAAIAVSAGPGSFTGLRIAMANMQGLAFSENIPQISVSTLEAMAENLRDIHTIICCVMDARAGQVYNAIFDNYNGDMKRLSKDRAIKIEDLKTELANLEKKYIFVGDGANLCYNNIDDENKSIASANILMQNAYGVAKIAQKHLKLGEYCAKLDYLRIPQAQRQLEENQ